MADEKREVNFDETVKLPEETEEVDKEETDVENETETQSESSKDENQADESKEEKSDTEESEKTQDKQESEEISEETAPVIEKEPNPVEGETLKEKALRLEIQRVKKALRDEKSKKLLGNEIPIAEQKQLSQEDQEILKAYDPNEVQNFEKIIDVIAKKKGWVRESEFKASHYQQQASDVLDTFLESHPEYLAENDKDNLLWGRFQQEFSLYKRPTNPRDLKRIFDKVHGDVFGITQTTDSKKINAQKEKIKVASHSGASPKSPKVLQPNGDKLDSSLKDKLIGFDEDEKTAIIGE